VNNFTELASNVGETMKRHKHTASETNPKQIQRRIENAFDRLLEKLFENAVLVYASLVQTLIDSINNIR